MGLLQNALQRVLFAAYRSGVGDFERRDKHCLSGMRSIRSFASANDHTPYLPPANVAVPATRTSNACPYVVVRHAPANPDLSVRQGRVAVLQHAHYTKAWMRGRDRALSVDVSTGPLRQPVCAPAATFPREANRLLPADACASSAAYGAAFLIQSDDILRTFKKPGPAPGVSPEPVPFPLQLCTYRSRTAASRTASSSSKTSASVVNRLRLARTEPSISAGSIPIASSTWLRCPLAQADPAET